MRAWSNCLCMKMAERSSDSVSREGSSQMLVSSFFPSFSSSETESSVGSSSRLRQPSTVDDSGEERAGVTPDSDERAALPPSKRRRDRPDKRTFHEEWKMKYLMWPNQQPGDAEATVTEMICILCQERMKAKSSTAVRHLERKHATAKSLPMDKKQRLVKQFECMYARQRNSLTRALQPDQLSKLAPYKLAFVIGKHKMPFSTCNAFLEFSRSADPNSPVFSRMAGSRDTVTKRTQEIHQGVLKPLLLQAVNGSPFWSVVIDESTDSATMEQLGVYVRYLDLENGRLCEEFLEFKRIVGHPNATNIFTSLMEVFSCMPVHALAGFTSDGAAVMISPKEGVLGKLRRNVNSKIFATHCPPHRLVLACKEGQKEIPSEIEKTVSDTLFFFKDSSVRRDEFTHLKELVEPDSPHIRLVQYHKVRWLSLSDCVSRLVMLLPLLVQYFEEQANDTQNRQAVRNKCQDLHARLSQPLFQLYLYFLAPHLELLSGLNKWLQNTKLTLHTVYSKVQALMKSFSAPVALDADKSLTDQENLRDLEEAITLMPGSDFQKHLLDCSEHALLTERKVNGAKQVMYNYIVTTGKALERRFPEMDLIVRNTAFIDPAVRSLQQPDIQLLAEKFHTGQPPFVFDSNVLKSQYRLYINDTTQDFQYELCAKDYVRFWCKLFSGEEFKELATLALLLLTISPTSVICERGFSVMNYVKNEFRSVLTQENLNACMALALTDHTVDTFPFTELLKRH